MPTYPDVNPDLRRSPIFRVRGQRSRWYYPNENLTPEHCELLRNVNITERGTALRRYGYQLYNSAQFSEGSKSVTGLAQQTWKTNGAQQVECGGTKVYANNGTTRKDITGAFSITDSATNLYKFAFTRDALVATNSVDDVWQWGGDFTTPTAIAAISGAPFTCCEDVVIHRNLLMVLGPTESGTKYPTRIRWNDIETRTFTTSITSWPTANRYELYDGGPAIIGAVDNWGFLNVFKRDGMYPCYVDYVNGLLDFKAPERNNLILGFTPIARCGMVVRPEFIFVVCAEGCLAIRPDLTTQWITKDVQSDWLALNQDRLPYAVSWIRAKDHQVRTLVSSSSNSTGHDQIMVWDWESNDVWFDTPNDKMNYAAQLKSSNVEYDYLGTTTGYTMQGNTSTTDNGSTFMWQIKMAPNDLGLPGVTKTIVNFISLFRNKAGQTAVDVRIERDMNMLPTRQQSQTWGTSYKWNTGIKWNSGKFWPGGTTDRKKFGVNRKCENFRPRWSGTGNVELVGYQVDYMVHETVDEDR